MPDMIRRSSVATLHDVARAAGVSVGTVSKALNRRGGVSSAIAEQIIETARRLGYQKRQLAPEPAAIASATILTYDRFLVSGQFYGEVLDGLLKEGDRQGLDLAVELLPSGDLEARLARGNVLGAAPPQAAIILGIDAPALVDAVHATGIPAVLVNGVDRRMRLPSVSPDYHLGGWLAARHLLERGHRDIVHVTHPWRTSFSLRLDGFRDALADFGIVFDPNVHLLDTGSRDLLSLDAHRAVERRLALGLTATGFVCAADMLAVGVVQALSAAGLTVPGDASVIGFDDLPMSARCSPPLTSIRIDRAELGRVAVDLLLEHAAQPSRAVQRIAVSTKLVERESVATRYS